MNAQRLQSFLAVIALMPCGACSTAGVHPANTQHPALLQASGSGVQTTAVFTVSGPWSIAWSFDCGSGSGGSFFVDVYNAADHTPDFQNRGVDAEGEQHAADTSRFTNPGTFYLEITSTCAWSIEVFE